MSFIAVSKQSDTGILLFSLPSCGPESASDELQYFLQVIGGDLEEIGIKKLKIISEFFINT